MMCDTFWDDPDCVEFYLDMKAGLYDNTEDEEEEEEKIADEHTEGDEE